MQEHSLIKMDSGFFFNSSIVFKLIIESISQFTNSPKKNICIFLTLY